MFANLILGFLIPWASGMYILRQDKGLILKVGPIAGLIAFAFNDIGYDMQWWYVTPRELGVISFLPYNVGVFPVIACFLFHVIKKSRINSMLLIILFTLLKTILEACLLFSGKVIYNNGWNLVWTFISYIIACSITYCFYLIFTKYYR